MFTKKLVAIVILLGTGLVAKANMYDESWLMNCSEGEESESLVSVYMGPNDKHESGMMAQGDATAFLACPMFIFNGIDKGYPFVCAGVWEMDFIIDPVTKQSKHVDTVLVVNFAQKEKEDKSKYWTAKFTSPRMHGSQEIEVPCVITYNEGTPWPVALKETIAP